MNRIGKKHFARAACFLLGIVLSQLWPGGAGAAALTSTPPSGDPNFPNLAETYQRAQKGDAKAQAKLGDYYFSQSHFTNAVCWYQRAARQGSARAQNSLADCYRTGRGVSKNLQEAARWSRLALHQVHKPAPTPASAPTPPSTQLAGGKSDSTTSVPGKANAVPKGEDSSSDNLRSQAKAADVESSAKGAPPRKSENPNPEILSPPIRDFSGSRQGRAASDHRTVSVRVTALEKVQAKLQDPPLSPETSLLATNPHPASPVIKNQRPER
jgi:Sel1 repeat